MVPLSMKNNIAIVGGGPSGIFCALQLIKLLNEAKISDYSITIFDKSQILRTILPTGNGRCNLTNAISDVDEFISNYPRGKKFLYSVFSKHFNYDSIEFFNSIGVETYVQDDLRVFPKSNSASSVKNKMLDCLKTSKNVKLKNLEITEISQLKDYDFIVFATGSKVSLSLLKSTKVNIIPFKKALCGLKVLNQKENNIYPKGVSVKSLDGDFIFTDFGVSGPLIFKISSLSIDKKFPYVISIRLFEVEKLADLIKENPKKSIGNLVSKFIPRSLAKVIVDDFDKNCAEISKEKIEKYSILNLTIVDTASDGEIVRAGGADLDDLTPNCKLKSAENIWFCGEVLNIDGFCGGFNLQNCWSSAYVTAFDIYKHITVS